MGQARFLLLNKQLLCLPPKLNKVDKSPFSVHIVGETVPCTSRLGRMDICMPLLWLYK